MPLSANREIVREFLNERKATGIKPSTLMIDANALRGFCLHLDARSLREATRADVVAYIDNASRVRVWRNARAGGSFKETTQEVALSARLGAQRLRLPNP